jgi:pimeloyl-ACP methyl ester carboxylesterase
MAQTAVAMTEIAVLLGTADSPRVGIVTTPADLAASRSKPAVVLLNAGLLHRVGPNRLHAKLARRLAAGGHLVLRFDFSGIGDSPARRDGLPFEQAAQLETFEALNFLAQRYEAIRFVACGLCSGGDVALRAALKDPRISGAIMINGTLEGLVPGRSGAAYDEAAHETRLRYYRKKLTKAQSLRRFLTLKTNYRALAATLFRSMLRRPPRGRPQTLGREIPALAPVAERLSQGFKLLVIFSEGSTALDLLNVVLGRDLERLPRQYPGLEMEVVKDVDHVFTPLWSQELLVDRVARWLNDSGC